MILIQEAETHESELRKSAEQQFNNTLGADQLIQRNKSTFEPNEGKIQKPEVPRGEGEFQEAPKQDINTLTVVSTHLSNTTAKRRDVAKGLMGQLRKVAEENCADIMAGDFNSSAYRERGKAGVSFIEETWEETLLLPPPGVVPMWGQMKESGDCCGFIIMKKSEPSWRVAKRGCFQLNKDKMQMKATDQAAHFSVYIHLCEAQTFESSARSEFGKNYRKQRRTEIRCERRQKKSQTRSACRDAGRADGPCQWSAEPSMAFLFSSL